MNAAFLVKRAGTFARLPSACTIPAPADVAGQGLASRPLPGRMPKQQRGASGASNEPERVPVGEKCIFLQQ